MTYEIERTVASLQDPEASTRLGAAAAMERRLRSEFAETESDREALAERMISPLIAALGDPFKGVQVHAAYCLELLAPHARSLIPSLRLAMRDPSGRQAWGAAMVAARLSHWFPEIGPALSLAMGADDRDIRWAAACYCLELGRHHPEAMTVVHSTLKSEHPAARKMACYCLGVMGRQVDAEEALASCLADPDRDVRRAALLSINKLPRISSQTLRQVAALVCDQDVFVRRTAQLVAAKDWS